LAKIIHYSKRQSKFDRFFSRGERLDDHHHGPHHKGPLLEKPSYQYGVVGQSTSTPVSQGQSLPSVQNAFGNNSGVGQTQGLPQSLAGQAVFGNDGGLGQVSGQVGGSGQGFGPPGLGTGGGLGQNGHGVIIGNLPSMAHTGDPSITLPIAGITTTAAASGLLAASRSSSSRPSSGSSSQALGPLVTPANSQRGYLPTQQSWNTTHGSGQAHAGPSTSSAPNNNNRRIVNKPSIADSVASTSSAYSRSSWIGNSSTTRIADDNIVPPLPSMEASSHRQQYRQRQEAPLYDEQGRPLNMPPEKAPLVHLDGALYQEPRRADPRSEYEPPAYIE
jgi:hypothetical protein